MPEEKNTAPLSNEDFVRSLITVETVVDPEIRYLSHSHFWSGTGDDLSWDGIKKGQFYFTKNYPAIGGRIVDEHTLNFEGKDFKYHDNKQHFVLAQESNFLSRDQVMQTFGENSLICEKMQEEKADFAIVENDENRLGSYRTIYADHALVFSKPEGKRRKDPWERLNPSDNPYVFVAHHRPAEGTETRKGLDTKGGLTIFVTAAEMRL